VLPCSTIDHYVITYFNDDLSYVDIVIEKLKVNVDEIVGALGKLKI